MRHFDSPAGRMALAAVMSACSLVMMLVLGAVGIGTYAGPLLGGVCTLVVGRYTDRRTALLHWLATGLLGLMLCPDKELALLYLALLGWYPLAKGRLDILPMGVQVICKAMVFNTAVVAVYAGMLYLLYGGDLQALGFDSVPVTALLLALGNGMFFFYDRLLNRIGRRLK